MKEAIYVKLQIVRDDGNESEVKSKLKGGTW